MPNIAIIGGQWGDEGKGKIVDLITPAFEIVARFNGGHNAGHTVIRAGTKLVLHLIPSGILHDGVLCVLGHGLVIDPAALDAESREVEALGFDVAANLVISDRAHVLLPHHRALDLMSEERKGSARLGTTGRGIGPCYEDKAARRGMRISDVLLRDRIDAKLAALREHFEALCRGHGVSSDIDWSKTADDLEGFGARIAPRVRDIAALLHRQMTDGYAVLFEGAQATLLDLDHGTYPFVTSSSAGVGGVVTGLGVPPSKIDGVLGIVKAYTTRVGTGPLPTELKDEAGEGLRERGGEYGATTGRPRRCGWFDAVVARYSARLNGFEGIALTKLDVLDTLEEIPICVGYRYRNTRLDDIPADVTIYEECKPIYENMKGWKTPTSHAREWRELPQEARDYIRKIGDLVGVEVPLVSIGPDRDESVIDESTRTAGWLRR
ncbi:MAG: adenylosuccinate synthase [Vicinamibacteria bacterium]|nr:adenylosuccinate synthase [Vicinamibacteria bacterium]